MSCTPLGLTLIECVAVNNVAAHGIPDSRPLIQGDILNIDVTVYFQVPASPFLLHQCCGSGSGIRCLVTPGSGIRNGLKIRIRIPRA